MNKKFFKLPYIVTYLCAFVLGLKQLREPDIWWQLLSGEWMLEHGAVTRTDPFSYTMEGTSWVNVKWLYEVIIAFLEKGFGPHGVLLLQGLINVAIVYLLLRIVALFTKHLSERLSTFYSVVAVVLFLALSEFRMAGRPEMVSHIMTVLYMFILWRTPKLSWKGIVWLVPLQCLWANMHEGYPVGIVIIGIYAGGSLLSYLINKDKEQLQSTIRIGAIFLGAILAILLNPNTIQLWKQPFEIYRQLGANKYTTELFSFTEPRYWTLQAKVHVAMLVLVVAFWIYRIVLSRKEKNGLQFTPLFVGYLISIPVLGYLSLTANRNIPFSQIALFPSVPVLLLFIADKAKLSEKSFYKNAVTKTTIISTAAAAIFYIAIVSNGYYKFTESPNRYGAHISTLHNPTNAADFIRQQNIQGPAFSDYFISSYLLWDLYPDFKSYIDLRDLDIFPSKFFDEYFEMYNNPRKFYELDSTYKFNYVILSTSQLTGVQQQLYWNQGFNVVYIDPISIIFLRETEQNKPINTNLSIQKLFTWPQEPNDPGWATAVTKLLNPTVSYDEEDPQLSPMYAAKYYNMVGNYNVSKKLLLPALSSGLGENGEALSTIGYTYFEMAKRETLPARQGSLMDTATMYFNMSLNYDKERSSTYLGLANIELMKGNFLAAEPHLKRSIELDEFNDYLYFAYGVCMRNIWRSTNNVDDLNAVIESMERSLELNEDNEKVHLYLAEGYWAKNDRDKAREHMKKAVATDAPLMNYEEELMKQMQQLTGIK